MNKKRKIKKIIILLIILLIIVISGVLIYHYFFSKTNNKKIVVLKEIENYGYKLEKRDTKLMTNTFNELEDILKEEPLDYQKYAECLTKLFVIDLYTISNKIDTYDVGGAEYIYPDDLEEYKNNVMSTLYNYIGYIDDREEKMPEVKEIESIESSETTFIFNDEEYEAYEVNISWKYEKDLGYDDKASVIVFKVNDKLFIGEFTTGGDQNE